MRLTKDAGFSQFGVTLYGNLSSPGRVAGQESGWHEESVSR
jgi:hypothetical protein